MEVTYWILKARDALSLELGGMNEIAEGSTVVRIGLLNGDEHVIAFASGIGGDEVMRSDSDDFLLIFAGDSDQPQRRYRLWAWDQYELWKAPEISAY